VPALKICTQQKQNIQPWCNWPGQHSESQDQSWDIAHKHQLLEQYHQHLCKELLQNKNRRDEVCYKKGARVSLTGTPWNKSYFITNYTQRETNFIKSSNKGRIAYKRLHQRIETQSLAFHFKCMEYLSMSFYSKFCHPSLSSSIIISMYLFVTSFSTNLFEYIYL
jgi:hypothetical protein